MMEGKDMHFYSEWKLPCERGLDGSTGVVAYSIPGNHEGRYEQAVAT